MRIRSRSFPPHIFTRENYARLYRDRSLAMLFPLLAAILFYGMGQVLPIFLLSVASAIFAEIFFSLISSQDFHIEDGWAFSLGCLITLFLPSDAPLFLGPIASALSVFLGKTLPGGSGKSLFAPVVTGLLFTFVLFPSSFAYYWPGLRGIPLDVIRVPAWHEQFLSGPGCNAIGSTSLLALLLSALFLMARASLDWQVSLLYLLGTMPLLLFPDISPSSQIFACDILLFALFVVPEAASKPLSGKGKTIYSLLAGLLTVPLRFFLGPMLGTLFALPFSRVMVPFLDYLFLPRARVFLYQGTVPRFYFSRLLSLPLSLASRRRKPSLTIGEVPPEAEKVERRGGEKQTTPKELKRISHRRKEVLPLFLEVEFRVEKAEGKQLESICLPCLPDAEQVPESLSFIREQARRDWCYLLALKGEEPIGFSLLAPAKAAIAPVLGDGLLHLHCIFVKEEERGKGIGRRLLKNAEEIGHPEAISFLSPLESKEDQKAGRKMEDFLLHLGFEVLDEGWAGRLLLKKITPQASARLLPLRIQPQEGNGKITLQAIRSPHCPLLALNYREAFKVARALSPDSVTQETLLRSQNDLLSAGGCGFFVQGDLVFPRFVNLRELKRKIRSRLGTDHSPA